jgi:hypothetical protein
LSCVPQASEVPQYAGCSDAYIVRFLQVYMSLPPDQPESSNDFERNKGDGYQIVFSFHPSRLLCSLDLF